MQSLQSRHPAGSLPFIILSPHRLQHSHLALFMTYLLVAESRIRRSSTDIILTTPSTWILSSILIMSLALKIVIETFNAHLWHLPTLTYITYI